MHPKKLSINDYTYSLPPERIAAFPLPERDASKLLIYQDRVISQDIYRNIDAYIPENALLVFNNTKVIQARILFKKPTGAVIEIFCLEPFEMVNEYSSIMNQRGAVKWKCMIGGASKWREGSLVKRIEKFEGALKATLVERLPDAYVVELSWQPADLSFAEVLEQTGDMPLPPYIKRKAAVEDKDRYQTIYAVYDGSVAAPTAGLHFTENIFAALSAKNIRRCYVTLHVGAGTFKPVKAELMEGHDMHAEWIDVSSNTMQQLIEDPTQPIIAVGTTSLRTIESLYWMGVKTLITPSIKMDDLAIRQWEVYENSLAESSYSTVIAITALLNWMKINELPRLITTTQLLISPGYQFRVAKAIITNFHQPQSTLLLLVAAAVGHNWKQIYQYAMDNDFRFLSYGDGCLLFINPSSAYTG